MDRDDWLYVASIVLVGFGAGMFHPGAGLMCAGVGVGFPFVVAIWRSGAPRKKE